MSDIAELLKVIQQHHADNQLLFKTTADRLDNGLEKVQTASMNTARELGGVQTALTAINTNVTRIENRVSSVEEKQATCQARQDNRGINARLKKVETFKEKIQEERGEVTGVVDMRGRGRDDMRDNPGMAAAVATATTKDIILKAGPWIIAAMLTGAAIGGYLLKGLLQ
jgi:archaellum component FlaC